MLLILGLSSYEKITGDRQYHATMSHQRATLSAELAKAKNNLRDDYPGECYPADMLWAAAAIQRAGRLEGAQATTRLPETDGVVRRTGQGAGGLAGVSGGISIGPDLAGRSRLRKLRPSGIRLRTRPDDRRPLVRGLRKTLLERYRLDCRLHGNAVGIEGRFHGRRFRAGRCAASVRWHRPSASARQRRRAESTMPLH